MKDNGSASWALPGDGMWKSWRTLSDTGSRNIIN